MARGLEGVDPSILFKMVEEKLDPKELKVSFSTLSPCFVRLARAGTTCISPYNNHLPHLCIPACI